MRIFSMGHDITNDTPTPPETKKPWTPHRVRRRLRRIAIIALLVLVAAIYVTTHTGVTKAIVLPRLAAAVGADIDARSLVLTVDGSVLLRDVVVRVPGMDGPESELFIADRLLVELNWGAITTPNAVRSVELESPRLRVSQDAETGRINATGLGIFQAERSGGAVPIPSIVVRNGVVELGEHRPRDAAGKSVLENTERASPDYLTLAEFPISGVLTPQITGTAEPSGRSFFALTPRAGESGLEITGYIDDTGVTCTLGGLQLDDWPMTAIPTRFRDLWEKLDLKGRIVPRTIAVSSQTGAEITTELQGVALTLPFAAENARSDEPARLTEVSGRLTVSGDRVSADLAGRAGTLEQSVTFDHYGFDPRTSPFLARLVTPRLRWERDIALLDYVPPDVIEQTDRFGKPEADVEAVVWLARRADEIPRSNPGELAGFVFPDDILPDPDQREKVRLSGTLAMRRGTAAFRGFPYTFHDLSIDFRFNTDRLLVENIDGVSRSGARLTGSGWISPLGPTSAVDLDLAVSDLEIDDELLGALNPARRQLVNVLFNRREHQELLEEGFIRTPDDAAPLTDRLASIEAERAAWVATPGIGADEQARLDQEESNIRAQLTARPVFALGGVAQVDMRFIRREGVVSVWTRDIDLRFPSVGFLTEMFPMPAIGENVRVEIGEDELRLNVDEGRALSGGAVSIEAVMDTSDAARAASPDGDTLPAVHIETADIPIDPLLIRAIAGPEADESAEAPRSAGPVRLAALFNALGLSGTVDSVADITPTVREGRSALDYKIASTLVDLSADIESAGAVLAAGSGHATVTRDSVEFDISGDLRDRTTGAQADAMRIDATITLPQGSDWGDLRSSDDDESGDFESASTVGKNASPAPRPAIDATITLPRADIRIPAEPIVALFDRTAAGKLADLRSRYQPAGSLGVATHIRGSLGPEFGRAADVRVHLFDIDRTDFDYQGLRLSASQSEGRATVRLQGEPRVEFDAFAVDLETIDTDGTRHPAGRLGILEPVKIGDAFLTTPLSITLDAGRFESPLTRTSIRNLPTLVSLADAYDPHGAFDLELARDDAGIYSGRALPSSATISTPRGRLDFSQASGAIAFAGKAGTFESIRLVSQEATLTIDGSWAAVGDAAEPGIKPGTDIALRVNAETRRLSQSLLGLAPVAIGEIFDTLELEVAGPLSLEGLDLSMRAIGGGEFADVTANGTARFNDASLAIGLPVTEVAGVMRFDADRPDPDRPAKFGLTLDADRARFKGLRVTNAQATILSGDEPGSVLVPDFEADAHGGRLTAGVRISAPAGGAPTGARRYWTDVQLAEIRIAPLLADVRIEPDPAVAEALVEADWNQADDRSRGLVSASLSFSGTVGTPEGRRGRGRVIAGGGPIIQLPLFTRLIEVANLQVPVGENLGLAYANMLIDADRVVLEDFAILSGRVELLGAGDLTLPSGDLDLRVRSRALNRVPVLTDVVESLRDELFSTRISGTIAEPEIVPVALEETRRVLGSLMGGQTADSLRSIGASDESVRRRIRQAGALLGRRGDGQATPVDR